MNYTLFMVGFIVAVLVLGLLIFFYWRSTYGVWAQQKKGKTGEQQAQAQTIKYD